MLAIATGLLATWMIVNAAFVTPTYYAEGVYRPWCLLAGFAAIAVLDRSAQEEVFRAAVGVLAALVLVGCLQYYYGFWHLEINPGRSAGTFITPNTFATAINLFLLPLVALSVTRQMDWKIYALALWLFAGLLTTGSRGGFLGLLVGCVFVAAASGIPRSRRKWFPWFRILGGLLAVLLAFVFAESLTKQGLVVDRYAPSEIGNEYSAGRRLLASIAIDRILERPIAGYGADMYWPLNEMAKPAEFETKTFYFVHNDYLQYWLEYGLFGVLLLGSIVVLAIAHSFRVCRSRESRSRENIDVPLASGAALVSCFAHASVDFPLFVPFLLMVVGAYLGALARFQGDVEWIRRIFTIIGERLKLLRTRVVCGVLAAAALVWLALPVAANMAADKALGELFAARPDAGLFWQSVARHLEPRNAMHCWAEAVIWRDQAVAARNRDFAARADALFAEASRINPYEINYYIERARLHRRHAELLEDPASPNEIIAWTDRAVQLRPHSILARAEHARALAHAGRADEAKRIARVLLDRNPKSGSVLRLAADLNR